MFFQSGQCFFVVTDQHTFTWREVYCCGEFFFLDNLQIIQFGFGMDMFVAGTVCQDSVIMISEYGETILACLLFQIGQHFRVDSALEQDFSILRIDYLATVVGNNKAPIVTQFKRFGQWHEPIGRSAGSQYNTHTHLLHLEQRCKSAFADFLCIVEECSVYVKN